VGFHVARLPLWQDSYRLWIELQLHVPGNVAA
jgi:hypothetical protein